MVHFESAHCQERYMLCTVQGLFKASAQKMSITPVQQRPVVSSPAERFHKLKLARTKRTRFDHTQVVRVARACIDEVIAQAEGVDGGAYLEQQWNM